jgi:multimeric flavodoxin WrbA
MTGKPVIILGSARKDSDTKNFLERVFVQTDYKLIDLLDFHVSPFSYLHGYSTGDEFLKIIEKLIQEDAIVFATPVYWYAMSGLMKIFFDRLTDLVTIKKPMGKELKGKSTFLIVVGKEEEMPPGFETPFKFTSTYLNMSYEGCIYYSTKHPKSDEIMQHSIDTFISKIKSSG